MATPTPHAKQNKIPTYNHNNKKIMDKMKLQISSVARISLVAILKSEAFNLFKKKVILNVH